MKILLVSTVARQFYLFDRNNIKILISLGFEVHCAANQWDNNPLLNDLKISKHQIDFNRNPLSLTNIKAYYQLKRLMKENHYSLLHCHSPVGGIVSRLLAMKLNFKNVIYTAHGFHFYKGSSFISWLVFYQLEKFFSRFTKLLITINKEDFNIAKLNFHTNVIQIPGVGIDTTKYISHLNNNSTIRKELSIPDNTKLLINIGELIPRKNQMLILKALASKEFKDLDYILIVCGVGKLMKKLQTFCLNNNLLHNVQFLGYRKDIKSLLNTSDLFLFPSFQEGLPVALMEAMAAGLPVICSDIRGNNDLVSNNINGFLFKSNDLKTFKQKLLLLLKTDDLKTKFRNKNLELIKNFDSTIVDPIMKSIYERFLNQ
jgi:glycosyltransferase involved in cell wall biosynthesis